MVSSASEYFVRRPIAAPVASREVVRHLTGDLIEIVKDKQLILPWQQ